MRIAIDARELCGQPTGVGRYLGSVLAAWRTQPEAAAHHYILCAHEPVPPLDLAPLSVEVRIGAGGSGTAWEQARLPLLVRAARADVLFSPAYTSPLWCPAPVVLAIHDVSFAAHPEWFPWRQRLRQRVLASRAARQAAQVLTLTEFSRREIRDWLGVPAHRISVVPPGVTVWPSSNADSITPEPSVLFVGSIFARRHVPELVEAVALLARRYPALTLTLVGHNRTMPPVDISGLARRLDVGDRVVHHEYVADTDLAVLYQRARAFAFLSEYEGFGLPPLEALAAGVPPVVLDTPVAREAYGAGAIYLAHPEPATVADGLEHALFDDEARRRVFAAAPGVLARTSWAACAAGVLRALETTRS
jgi:glycosyltransferase involved in cell wall biosynthesis